MELCVAQTELWRSCSRISTNPNKEARQQPIKMSCHPQNTPSPALRAPWEQDAVWGWGNMRGVCVHVRLCVSVCVCVCVWVGGAHSVAVRRPRQQTVSLSFLTTIQRAVQSDVRPSNRQNVKCQTKCHKHKRGRRLPRCWSNLGPRSHPGTGTGWCWGSRPPRTASSGRRTVRGRLHTLDTQTQHSRLF